MKLIDKLLCKVAEWPKDDGYSCDLNEILSRLSDDQLRELADGDPSDERIKEILDSTG